MDFARKIAWLAVVTASAGCNILEFDDEPPEPDACANDPSTCVEPPNPQGDATAPELDAGLDTPSYDETNDAPTGDGATASSDDGDEAAIEADASDAGEAGDVSRPDAPDDVSAPPPCENGGKDGDETDVDCGGGTCPACGIGRACGGPIDCAEGTCSAGHKCVPLACVDGARDGTESDVDCGGTACDACAIGQACEAARDCATRACHATRNVCVASTCEDASKDGSETDVDCGGSCAACDVNSACAVNGDCMTGNCANAFCALATSPPVWRKAASMPILGSPVQAAVMTFGNPRGTIVVVSAGGALNYGAYDIATATWSMPSLPGGVSFHAMTADLLGRVYLVGGSLTNTWVYDGAWATSLAPPRVPRQNLGFATGSDGLLYAVGGRVGDYVSSVVEVYDPAADRWTTLPAPMPTPRTGLGVVALGRRVYAIGGMNSPQLYLVGRVEAYDVDAKTWSTRGALPAALSFFGSAAGPDGRIYVAGGNTSATTPLAPTASVLAYDPASDRWTPVRPLSAPRSDFALTVSPDGRIYALGDGTQKGTVEVYGPVVALSPSHAAPDATVLVTGGNFAANAKVSVYLGSDSKGTILKTGTTTALGDLIPTLAFKVPDVPSGEKVVTVVDDRSRYPIRLSFTVD